MAKYTKYENSKTNSIHLVPIFIPFDFIISFANLTPSLL